jgi:GAF domain-containing protein
VLKVISRSAFDLQAVLDTLVESAYRLSGATYGLIYLRTGEHFECKAIGGMGAEEGDALFKGRPISAGRGTAAERVIATGEIQSIPDLFEDPEFDPKVKAGIRDAADPDFASLHSLTAVPMKRDDDVVGVIVIARSQTGLLPARQIELLQTFADQAVIAIENARLFDEVQARTRDLSESLQQQTATADVLKVISRSAFDLQTVLDTLVRSAARLCEADASHIYLREGDDSTLAACSGFSREYEELLRGGAIKPGRGTLVGRTVLEGKIVHLPDALADPEYTFHEAQRLGQFRTMLGIPMLRDGVTMGVLAVTRSKVLPFSDKQIDLVQTFADQAVIAIENVRLFDEVQARTRDLSESLQQQTATADVLKVISRSAFDLQTVLDTLVESAARLCEADEGTIFQPRGDAYRLASSCGLSPGKKQFLESHPFRPGNDTTVGRVLLGAKPIHIEDSQNDPSYRLPDPDPVRTRLGIPLLREGAPIGVFVLTRREARPFSDKQIELVQTFADQAVIAIENVRLFDEVQARTRDLTEALTYQTGSSNILKVIASSPTDVGPVLKAIVESACELCDAYDAVVRLREGDSLCFSAHHGPIPINLDKLPINRNWTAGRAVIDQKPVHVHDLLSSEGDEFPEAQKLSRSQNHRSVLSVPLLRENESIGAIVLRRNEVNPFSEKQIALLQTFADQAVIAIGNVRLFEEVQAKTRDLTEALTYQTGSGNILRVIASSPTDVGPVLKAIVESASELCEAYDAVVRLREGNYLCFSAHHGPIPITADKFPIDRGWTTGRSVIDKTPIHVQDLLSPEGNEFPEAQELARRQGHRTVLSVPLLRENESIGVIVLRRAEVNPFSEKQIALLQTFADQAVIAIGNVRLFEQVQERTRELSKSLDDLRTAQDRLIQTEKLASLGQLTAGIAHEIKNPLNFVNNFAALSAELTDELNDVLKPAALAADIQREVDELTGLLKDNLEKVVQHGKRADSIVKNMLLHSREGSGDHRPADINALLDESLNLAYHGARAEKPQFNVTLQRNFDPNAGMIELFPQEITRVFLNLISNGFYAVTKRRTENGTDFEPVVSATTTDRGDHVEIRIRDNGTGIPPEVREKMFNPFFTTKPAGEGTGLGLSMSHDIIVKQHGGTIDVETEPGRFTEFRIVLPRTSNISGKIRGQS